MLTREHECVLETNKQKQLKCSCHVDRSHLLPLCSSLHLAATVTFQLAKSCREKVNGLPLACAVLPLAALNRVSDLHVVFVLVANSARVNSLRVTPCRDS